MPQITFNLSQTSLSPGWDPHSALHDHLWRNFAAGYKYRILDSDGTQYDSLRGSDPATRGTSDTFQSSAGSLDLSANNFAGNVSLDWLDATTARLSLDSAWNTIKNVYVSDFSGSKLILENWVDAWVSLDNTAGQEILVDGAKRGEISTGSGSDVVWIGADSNGADWTNYFKIDTGDGDDVITIAAASRDYSGSAFSAAYNPDWTDTDIHSGAGHDTITGSGGTDTADGGGGLDTFVFHGPRSAYDLSWDGDTLTVTDTRIGHSNLDGTDFLTGIERLQFEDLIEYVGSPEDGDGVGVLAPNFSAQDIDISPSPALLTATLDFGDDPYDATDFGELSEAAQTIISSHAPGASAALSEAFSFEVLFRAANAELIKTEDQIQYLDQGGEKIDYTVEIDGDVFGVSAGKAAEFPPGTPIGAPDALAFVESSLQEIQMARANVTMDDQWSKGILHYLAIDQQAADAVSAAWNAVDDGTRGDTILIVTRTDGLDQSLYFVL
ncbi:MULTISPECIES: hypothetical protein [Bradyrhizobium]|uniref:hypothetical protein n=1 Tax=Bradyrhizobium TaxID=374 RepID=UPI00293E6146|nr:hypothetical protein [Bradyrhizobium sp. NDS-1]WOH73212.1 hypothetical protein RX330_33940 [Bradyrhizobium sp. NDS-1]